MKTIDCPINFISSNTLITLSKNGIGTIAVPLTAGVGCATAFVNLLASDFLKKRNIMQKKNTLSKHTVQILRKLYQKNLEDHKIDQAEYKSFSDMYKQFSNATCDKLKNDKTKPFLYLFFSAIINFMYKKTMFNIKNTKTLSKELYKSDFIGLPLLVWQL